jgi:hypothetical protein
MPNSGFLQRFGKALPRLAEVYLKKNKYFWKIKRHNE